MGERQHQEMCDAEIGMKLHSKTRWGDQQAVAELLSIDDSVNFQDPTTGNFPIHIAAQNGHGEVAQMLISAQADVNSTNSNGLSALHMAVEYDYFFTCQLLVKTGADPELTSNDGHKACTGIEGGKSVDDPLAAFTDARDAEQLEHAMKLMESHPEACDKMGFVQKFMARKKEIHEPALFTDEVKAKISNLIKKL